MPEEQKHLDSFVLWTDPPGKLFSFCLWNRNLLNIASLIPSEAGESIFLAPHTNGMSGISMNSADSASVDTLT